MVKAGLLPTAFGKALNRAHEIRLLADYNGDTVDIEQAAALVHGATEFIIAITAVIETQ